jgi:hypothetical protein
MFVKRDGFRAEQIDPSTHAKNPVARHKRGVVSMRRDLQPVLVGVAEIGLNSTFELEVVFHACRNNDSQPPALPLEQTVEHGGSGIDAGGYLGKEIARPRVPLTKRVFDGFGEATRLVVRRRLRLAHDKSACFIDKERVGHGAAGIHGHDVLTGLHAILPLLASDQRGDGAFPMARLRTSRTRRVSELPTCRLFKACGEKLLKNGGDVLNGRA